MGPLLSNPIHRFLLLLIVIMPLSMALWWYFLRDYLLLLLQFIVAPIVEILWRDYVIGLTVNERVWALRTSLSAIDNPINLLAIPISTNRFTVSFPLLWGLILATPQPGKIVKLILGSIILIPATLLIALLLMQFKLALNINHQPILTEVPLGEYLLVLPFSETSYYLMAVGRQLAMLVFPTLMPLLVWGLLQQRFIRVVLLEGLLTRSYNKKLDLENHLSEQTKP